MHFSKTYAELLLTLPPEFTDNAIEYRQLKKLLNKVVHELGTLGLSPAVLQELLQTADNHSATFDDGQENVEPSTDTPNQLGGGTPFPKVVYEFSDTSNHIAPQLRLWVKDPSHSSSLRLRDQAQESDLSDQLELSSNSGDQQTSSSLLWTLQRRSSPPSPTEENLGLELEEERLSLGVTNENGRENSRELVIPLITNTAFFELLSRALQSISTQLLAIHKDFVSSLEELAHDISLSARPASSISSFHPHSRVTSDPSSIHLPPRSINSNKTDLYTWREVFQLYVESEVFESVAETHRGPRPVEEAEERLALFAERVTQRGQGIQRKFHLKESRDALETFLQLNMFILNVKKFQFASAEATRKILKKFTKRTALPFPLPPSDKSLATSPYPSEFALIQKESISLPRSLVQAIGEILLPIIPQIDDYSCLICTGIAFKPIRLMCGHLFCVRCLVKMQKRGKDNCPMCRAPTVLTADRSNVDWALVNFMQDWFPLESREKQKSNESEAAKEEQQEMGIGTAGCVIA